MALFKNILVAVDLSQDSAIVLDKARSMAKQNEAELSIVHVIEPIAVGYAVEVTSVDIEGLHEEVTKQAKISLNEMGDLIGVPPGRLHTVLGQPAREIRELAKKIESDLIIMGGHGRHGWELIFGSTSSSVTHGAGCDLLIVHIDD
ncbi:MAG: universal stress protein [Gammaproteobacteria bacterium]|jgi:universal stress protein A|nr:universal stress protein [Gammaproteobacteria bacterium]MBT6043617.1 universal stress protein [Gammaproteobacteria bacterium]